MKPLRIYYLPIVYFEPACYHNSLLSIFKPMNIDAPINIAIQDDESSHKRELHISFKSEFVQLAVQARTTGIQKYINTLEQNIQKLDQTNTDRIGMEIVYQFCQSIFNYISSDELDLTEIYIVEIEQSVNIASLLNPKHSVN